MAVEKAFKIPTAYGLSHKSDVIWSKQLLEHIFRK